MILQNAIPLLVGLESGKQKSSSPNSIWGSGTKGEPYDINTVHVDGSVLVRKLPFLELL